MTTEQTAETIVRWLIWIMLCMVVVALLASDREFGILMLLNVCIFSQYLMAMRLKRAERALAEHFPGECAEPTPIRPRRKLV